MIADEVLAKFKEIYGEDGVPHLLSTAFLHLFYILLLSMLNRLQCFLYILYPNKTNPLYFSHCIKADFG